MQDFLAILIVARRRRISRAPRLADDRAKRSGGMRRVLELPVERDSANSSTLGHHLADHVSRKGAEARRQSSKSVHVAPLRLCAFA